MMDPQNPTAPSSCITSGANRQIPRVHIVGRKNSGKTTLICDLIEHLVQRGLRVATVKHTHHRHELDTPGKDSHQHRVAGAAAVGILTPDMTAVFVPAERTQHSDNREKRYAVLDSAFVHCDLVLVEGDLHTAAAKIEVWRGGVSETPYAAEFSAIAAVISDDPLPAGTNAGILRLARFDLDAIVNCVLRLAGLGD